MHSLVFQRLNFIIRLIGLRLLSTFVFSFSPHGRNTCDVRRDWGEIKLPYSYIIQFFHAATLVHFLRQICRNAEIINTKHWFTCIHSYDLWSPAFEDMPGHFIRYIKLKPSRRPRNTAPLSKNRISFFGWLMANLNPFLPIPGLGLNSSRWSSWSWQCAPNFRVVPY